MDTPSTVDDVNISKILSRVPVTTAQKKGARFWLIFVVLGVVSLLSALEASAIGNALPRIVTDLNGEKVYIWYITGYLITAAAFMPIWGQLADIFGRRTCMLVSILFFLVGSGVAGGAKNSAMMIGGRVVQGIGGAGQLTLTEIIISDIVALRERGKYVGIIGAVWALGTVIGPIIGGALANAGQWPWIFYLNCPISAIAFVLAAIFLRVNEPEGSIMKKIKRMDFIGYSLFLASLISIQIALADGGIKHPWKSWQILTPLLVGFAGLAVFLVWVWVAPRFDIEPVIPRSLFKKRTAAVGFYTTFIHGMLVFGLIYILPVYFEGILGSSPLRTGVQLFPFTFVTAPFAIVCGAVVARTGNYKYIITAAFCTLSLGIGLLQILRPNSPDWHWIVFQLIIATGAGVMFVGGLYPIQVSVEQSEIAAATALYSFMRNFGAVWGLAITTSIFNYKINVLVEPLAAPLREVLSNGGAFALASVGYKRAFGEMAPIVQEIATKALRYDYWTLLAFSLSGLLSTVFMKNLVLSLELDTEYGLKEGKSGDKESI